MPVVGSRPDYGDIGDGAVGDPGLLAVEYPVRSVAHGARAHAGGIRAEIRFGQAEAADGLAAIAAAAASADFCSSEPYVRIGYITSAPCTETKLRRPESPRSISCMTSPYSTLLMPAQP